MATDDQSKEETQNIKSGRRVTVRMAAVILTLLVDGNQYNFRKNIIHL